MAPSSTDTRARLLDAAAAEFAAHGIAGARTARIATAAGANEALLFRYFGGKQALFETVFEALVVATVDDVPITAEDLPGYAGALFDYYQAHPHVLRLAIWSGLERPDEPASPATVTAAEVKERRVADAQAAGTVADRLPARELLDLVVQLSTTGARTSPVTGQPVDPAVRRASIVAAVAVLTTPR